MDEAWVFGQDAELSKRFEFSFRKRGWPETVYIGFCRDTSHAALEFMVKRWSPNLHSALEKGLGAGKQNDWCSWYKRLDDKYAHWHTDEG
jgi:hypothetical protein